MDADLVYQNIKSSEDPSPRRRRAKLDVVQQADHRLCPHWHWILLWLSCAGNVLLVVAMILIGVHGLGCSSSTPLNRSPQNPEEMTRISNTHQRNHLESKTNSQLQAFRSCLRQHLCETTNAFTENASCNVCPRTWLLYEDKCYWFSTSILSWKQSGRDCAAKGSQLLVISNTREQKFVQDIIKDKSTWIGLTAKLPEEKWMWDNGSPLNQTLSQPLMADCGIIGKKGIASDICSAELHWICQKLSVFI
ncbi:killer cell lectin-like receptor subfamily B member 1B allele C [Pantherophis guttatus]|uniref:Killer cell lectin-like receptor subfamily B member 1B allele C n=1 Tax=Pantherophis guttatus TaxID=94885 RepID=A0A6P9CEE0_PANGU|nr:killer cell lectin-like receptor subfamily B member 1B allele C [Pantherophis guttatus]